MRRTGNPKRMPRYCGLKKAFYVGSPRARGEFFNRRLLIHIEFFTPLSIGNKFVRLFNRANLRLSLTGETDGRQARYRLKHRLETQPRSRIRRRLDDQPRGLKASENIDSRAAPVFAPGWAIHSGGATHRQVSSVRLLLPVRGTDADLSLQLEYI